MPLLHIGLVINPVAGLGGNLAMKGSDGEDARAVANERASRSGSRALRTLKLLSEKLSGQPDLLQISCWGRAMGEDAVSEAGFDVVVAGTYTGAIPEADDTRRAAGVLRDCGIDLLVFVGGDGTARDVYDALGVETPALGIPAGVKMQSGVFALSPEAAAELLLQLAQGGLVDVRRCEVRDIDEAALREGRVNSRFYGELLVPFEGRFLQHTKIGGREDPELAADDIGAWLAERISGTESGASQLPHTWLLGPGTTTAAISRELGVQCTLLGVDVVREGQVLFADATEADILSSIDSAPGGVSIVVTPTGGQGYLFGRGNQQFSPEVIRRVGRGNIDIVATKSKISALEGRPLLVDSNDADLDRALCGYYRVTTGYEDQLLYRLSDGIESA